ncbi:MAG: glycine zipper 2TM domain-containing protein [Gammaproteobacteria bacterium]
MNLKRTVILMAIPCLVATQVARADHDDESDDGGSYGAYDYARVVRVEPQVRHVRVSTPRRECYQEEVPVYERERGYNSATPTILGGIIGGVVGNTMGRGRGNTAATVAGTILGGSIGHDMGSRDYPRRGAARYVSQDTCRVVNSYRDEERVDGYRVTYRYNGADYVTHTDHDPGSRIRVRVAVQPDE